ncbi:MAG: T9SS type A sorting domain-containing protein [Dysgonamonadaceae bacterium]|jgi:hypothetical protein|nr:T9SS type A sorting domain-containing protein [Dysgonamonadaceae bacterium]
MKHLKLIALVLPLLLSTHLQAENIKQSFNAAFGPVSYSSAEATTEDWTYSNLQRGSTSSSFVDIFYGEGAVNLYAYSGNANDAYLISPEKTGGAGWISFWYKVRDVRTDQSMFPLLLTVSVSENGVDFTVVETVEVPPSDSKNFSYFSKVVNNPNVKKVKIAAIRPSGSYQGFEVNIDEIIITDAVSGGTPAHITSISDSRSLEGEINLSTSSNITVKGGGFGASNLTFSTDKGGGSPFVFASTPVTGASITESGYALPLNFVPTVKGYSTDFLKVTVDGLPEIVFPLKGAALERTIVEGFNEKGGIYDNGGATSFEYYSGWQVVNGTTFYAGPGGNASNAIYILEGDRSMRMWTSLTSPKKIGGVGTVFFMYRVYNPNQQIEFFTDISNDGINWTQVDSKIAAGAAYIPYLKTVNNANAKYVRIRIDQPHQGGGTTQSGIIVDEFVITENGQAMPYLEADAQTITTEQSSLQFSIPLTFTGIQSDVLLSIEDPQFALSKTLLTATEANGLYNLSVTYTPEAGKNYTSTALTVTGGGLLFPAKISVSAYHISPTLFTNFDGAWGGTSMGNYLTDAGWTLNNGYRNTDNTLYRSPGAVYINYGGSIVSPAKSGGTGTIHFFAKGSSTSNPTVATLFLSDDGGTWTPIAAATGYSFTGAAYEEYEFEVNSSTARYVKLEVSSASYNSLYIENFTVTANGKKIPHVIQANQPTFIASAGNEVSDNIELQGTNITSDVRVRFASGAAFSLHNLTTVPAADINNKTYNMPVYFQSVTGTYFLDTLYVSGDDFSFERPFPVKGYNKQDIIYQDFDGVWTQTTSYNNFNISGWEVTSGSATTYSVIDGRAHLQLSSANTSNPAGELLSLPKSGGVGTVSFLYKTDNNPVRLKIFAYKSLSEAPLATIDTVIPGNTPITMFEGVLNQPEAVYVKLQNAAETAWFSIYIDNIAVTASGKGTPSATVPEAVSLVAYPEETASAQIEIAVANVEDEVTFSLKRGDSFSIDKTGFTPASIDAVETVTVSYTSSADKSFVADTLMIESNGLLKPYQIILYGYIPQEKAVEDFNAEGWAPNGTDGNYAVDGWLVKNGTRILIAYEGVASVRLRSDVGKKVNASLTSPPKAGGVNKVSFYYRSETTKLYLQTSQDGIAWKNNDSIEVLSNFSDFIPYSAEIKERDALYFRIESVPTQNFSYWDTYIDSIVVDAMPYLRQAGAVEAISTTRKNVALPVKVAGLLDNPATISMKGGTESVFRLEKSTLQPADVNGGLIASFDAIFEGGDASGLYKDTIVISNTEIGGVLEISLAVDYTKPYLSLANTVAATQTTVTVPLIIPIEISGILNTEAFIAQDDEEHYTLSATTIEPTALENGTTATINVTFTASIAGSYPNEIRVTNGETDPVTIPLTVVYEPLSLDNISGKIQVYMSNKGILYISGAPAGTDVTVSNMLGQAVFRVKTNSANEQFKLPLPEGTYVVKVGERALKIK